MPRIWLCSRPEQHTSDTPAIYNYLMREFGDADVLWDAKYEEAGATRATILSDAASADFVMVVIGPGWADQFGRTPEEDVVYDVLLQTQALGQRTVPLLIQETRLPLADQLPDNLQNLSQLRPHSVRSATGFVPSMSLLVDKLKSGFDTRPIAPIAAEATGVKPATGPMPVRPEPATDVVSSGRTQPMPPAPRASATEGGAGANDHEPEPLQIGAGTVLTVVLFGVLIVAFALALTSLREAEDQHKAQTATANALSAQHGATQQALLLTQTAAAFTHTPTPTLTATATQSSAVVLPAEATSEPEITPEAEITTEAAFAPLPPETQVTVNTRTPLYADPSTIADVIRTAYSRTLSTVLPMETAVNGWVFVRLSSGEAGWLPQTTLTIDDGASACEPTRSGFQYNARVIAPTTLYESPTRNAPVIDDLQQDLLVRLINTNANELWNQVQLDNGCRGWLLKPTTRTVPYLATFRVNQTATLWASPSESSPRLQELEAGTIVTALDTQFPFFRVRLESGLEGWIGRIFLDRQ